ncbi:hypothetical protein JQ636_04820 [Bradyrhizobium japonicum]|uniref:hypothetical protein n=1 Tax=Bradyrhizobium japonicum TaxID=375 RepID=UPI001BA7FE20|nr:hypothetical protein [Bradyrhizobium japonicum]MBR0802854.1 hypothetical protein [Bradyrhizobium japonicum]
MLVVALLWAPLSPALAEDCFRTLIQDTRQFYERDISSLALAELIRREKSGSVDLAGQYGPYGGSFAQKSAQSYFGQSNVQYNRDRLESLATQTLSGNAVAAYRDCLRNGRPGPIIYVHNARPDAVTVTVKWVGAPRAASPTQGEISLTGGTLERPFPASWRTNESYARIVFRESGKDFRIVANIGGDSENAFVAYLPPEIPPPPPPRPKTQIFVGTTPNVNAGEASTNPTHKKGATKSVGFAIADGAAAGTPLYVGKTPNVNAGIITTKPTFRGQTAEPIGYAVKTDAAKAGDIKLYEGPAGTPCDGVVSDYERHLNCSMQFFGYAHQP